MKTNFTFYLNIYVSKVFYKLNEVLRTTILWLPIISQAAQTNERLFVVQIRNI